jgi:hypothetical protein
LKRAIRDREETDLDLSEVDDPVEWIRIVEQTIRAKFEVMLHDRDREMRLLAEADFLELLNVLKRLRKERIEDGKEYSRKRLRHFGAYNKQRAVTIPQ